MMKLIPIEEVVLTETGMFRAHTAAAEVEDDPIMKKFREELAKNAERRAARAIKNHKG